MLSKALKVIYPLRVNLIAGFSDLALVLVLSPLLFLLIWLPGAAIVHGLKEHSALRRFCYAYVIGIVIYALLGLTVPLYRTHVQKVLGGIVTVITLLSVFRLFRGRGWKAYFGPEMRFAAPVFFGSIFLGLAMSFVQIQYPDSLPDGAYVFKKHNLHVKVQLLTGNLPADNFIPFVYSDFLLRGISFKDNRPMLPGQEVTNRTVLLGLVATTVRGLLNPPGELGEPLGTFSYVGSTWPDVGRLGGDEHYSLFLVLGVVLQAGLVLSAFLLFQRFVGLNKAKVALILFILNPFFLSQLIFLWPKMLGAFFILLGIDAYLEKRSVALLAVFLGLGFHCHPYGSLFMMGGLAWVLCLNWHLPLREILRSTYRYCGFAGAVVLPWFIWVKFIVKIKSDLFAQNFFIFQADNKWLNFLWVRVVSLYETFVPHIFGVYPFNSALLFRFCIFTLPGSVGIIIFFWGYLKFADYCKKQPSTWLPIIVLPALLICFTFSVPTMAAVYGFHVITPLIVMAAVDGMWDRFSAPKRALIVFSQLALNYGIIAAKGASFGVFTFSGFTENGGLLLIMTAVVGVFCWQAKTTVFQPK